MNAPGDRGEQTGTTDIGEHQRTWKLFVALVRWVAAGSALLLLALLIFRTHA